MMPSLHKFPSTPHLAWLSPQPIRGDKLLLPSEVADFLSHSLVIEEKIDGANLGLSVDSQGTICFQNRGNWVEGKLSGQWTRLRAWAAEHETALRVHLPPGHVLFGEWCYARHSVGYDRLPDWFLGFDVYDAVTHRFWSSDKRDALLSMMEIHPVPTVARGHFDHSELIGMLESPSAYGQSTREGIYLRHEANGWLISRTKLVCPDFVQQITDHWAKGELRMNQLATDHHYHP